MKSMFQSIYPGVWQHRPGWPAGRRCWAQAKAAWTAEGDTPPLSPSPTRPQSACPCPSPRLARLLSGRDRRTRWPSPCWWGRTSRPSGPAARTVSGWRMLSGTAAGAGTAAPGWLWGLEEDGPERKRIHLLFTARCNFFYIFLCWMAAKCDNGKNDPQTDTELTLVGLACSIIITIPFHTSYNWDLSLPPKLRCLTPE